MVSWSYTPEPVLLADLQGAHDGVVSCLKKYARLPVFWAVPMIGHDVVVDSDEGPKARGTVISEESDLLKVRIWQWF